MFIMNDESIMLKTFFLVEKAFLGVLVILRERLFPSGIPSLHCSVQEKGTSSEALLQQSQQPREKQASCPPTPAVLARLHELGTLLIQSGEGKMSAGGPTLQRKDPLPVRP